MFQTNTSIKRLNTFGLNVLAKQYAEFDSADALISLLAEVDSHKMILGGGSNVLFTKNFDGAILKNSIKGIEVLDETGEDVFVKVGAGEVWHQFVLYCLRNNFAGVENLALIPGSVGASPIQNIGAYGVEIQSVFHSLQALHLSDKVITEFTNTDCAFGYRESVFKHKQKGRFAILNVTYKLSKKPKYNISYGAIAQEMEKAGVKEISIQAIANAVINIRQSKLPNPELIGNAGSFFKNPEVSATQYAALKGAYANIVGYELQNGNVKLAAGWLIEQCGWKGYRIGDAGCHEKQALVLVNIGNATGEEIFALSEKIIQSVFEKFGVLLEREVNII